MTRARMKHFIAAGARAAPITVLASVSIGSVMAAELQAPPPESPNYYREQWAEPDVGPPVVYSYPSPPPAVYYAYRPAPVVVVPRPYYARRPYGLAYGYAPPPLWAYGMGGPRSYVGYGPRGGRHLRW
jgi:hypothetical protein